MHGDARVNHSRGVIFKSLRSLSVALVGNMTAVDGSSEEAVVELQTTTATTTADASSTPLGFG